MTTIINDLQHQAKGVIMKAYILLFITLLAGSAGIPSAYAEPVIEADVPKPAEAQEQTGSSSSWEYPIVHFRNNTYRIIMQQPVSSTKVGPRLGRVQRNISSFDEVEEGNTLIDTSYQNGDSNVLKVEAPIYKMRKHSSRECIVVSHMNKYYKAYKK
ncbi:hypothetical protein [Paenibacillus shenyangensis]|uniref:hypothetical protein n=2 Tax=Paenibacillus TaxID=44249 RepID=UPI001EE76725|nr:hypothetical protein [Paenibacillus sp. A9]